MKTLLPAHLATALFAIFALQIGAAQAQIDPQKQRLNPAAGISNPGATQQGICIVCPDPFKQGQKAVVLPAAETPSNCPGAVPGVELPPGPCKSIPAAR